MSNINETLVIRVRNVNQALSRVRSMLKDPMRDKFWRDISPRGLQTMEYRGPVITEYQQPCERVVWSPHRNANPFFHLMESLWILSGRNDVKFLTEFNKQMAEYSDDGIKFHAPYGYRLRNWYIQYNDGDVEYVDQIVESVKLLRNDRMTRQVVMSIWDPARDLGAKTKDMPCNDLIMLKIHDGALDMTVACRSNDVLWGAYGANVVQFSMLQEFVATAVGVEVGIYRQISDSFHVYTDREDWKTLTKNPNYSIDPYQDTGIAHFPLLDGAASTDWQEWLRHCELFCEDDCPRETFNFFLRVADPMRIAWRMYKKWSVDVSGNPSIEHRRDAAESAVDYLNTEMYDCDWRLAAIKWLERAGGIS